VDLVRPTADRLDEALTVLQASEIAVYGDSDWTAHELREEWERLDVEQDAWLVEVDGRMAGVAYEDYEDAKLIIVWGCNASASGIHLVPHLKRAQTAGAKLVVIDPRRTPLGRMADLHLPVRPGTDLPVALALVRAMFDGGWANQRFLETHCDGVDGLRAAAEAWTIERAAAEADVDVRPRLAQPAETGV